VGTIENNYLKYKKKVKVKSDKISYEHAPLNDDVYVQVDKFPAEEYLKTNSMKTYEKIGKFDYFKHKIPVYS